MHLLPSQQTVAITKAMATFIATGSLDIYEPCNCGSRVRHNNGGNYHEIIFIQRDGDTIYVKEDSTCELDEPAEWRAITEAEVEQLIRDKADWL